MDTLQQEQERADRLAFPMFAAALVFLVLLAALIVLWVDIPRVAELARIDAQAAHGGDASSPTANTLLDTKLLAVSDRSANLMARSQGFGQIVFILLLLMWPLFIVEYFYTRKRSEASAQKHGTGTRSQRIARAVACFVPPLRLASQSQSWDFRIWLPILDWQHPGRQLVRTLERAFSKPMLIIALLILPILLVEYGLHGLVERNDWLRILLHVCTGFIWCAFATEFIIMMSATDKKLAYVKKNWIDLAIILLPLISFLRTIRVLRLARLAKIQKLAKVGRIYRMRGLVMKAVKGLMLFGVVNRLLRVTPEKTLQKLELKYEEKSVELDELKQEIDELKTDIASSEVSSD